MRTLKAETLQHDPEYRDLIDANDRVSIWLENYVQYTPEDYDGYLFCAYFVDLTPWDKDASGWYISYIGGCIIDDPHGPYTIAERNAIIAELNDTE